MMVCEWCSKGWHMACLTLPLDQVLVGFAFGAPFRHGSHNYIIRIV
jgi:hypothetical protein